jgi:hypothetical protein
MSFSLVGIFSFSDSLVYNCRRKVHPVLESVTTRPTHCAFGVERSLGTSKRKDVQDVGSLLQDLGNVSNLVVSFLLTC